MIKGLTDRIVLRRDGKIRAGTKDPSTGYPKNTPHFLLHDAAQLIPVLGENPTEIYFTVPSDNLNVFYRDDLRWYTKSELVCRSMHDYEDPTNDNQPMGSVAAFFKVGQEAQGLQKRPFPGMSRAFVRSCAYKGCPDYIRGNCSEHMFLDMIIPQYSMGAIFTLDSVSINAVLNAISTFQKAGARYMGKFSGQIYRLYKKKSFINFPDSKGNTTKRETDVVFVDNVSFAWYEENFKDKIDPVDWESLMYIRNRPNESGGVRLLAAQTSPPLLDPADSDDTIVTEEPAATSTVTKAAEQVSEPNAQVRGNDPAVAPLFEELASLLGKDNTEEARKATAKNFPDVQRLADYLKGRIRDLKKKTAKPVEPPPQQGSKAKSTPAQPTIEGNPLF